MSFVLNFKNLVCQAFFLTVEKNDAADGEVEKDSGPLGRIDHCQNNRHNENQNFYQKCPNYSTGQISPENKELP